MNEEKTLNQAKSLANMASFKIEDVTPAQLAVIKSTIAKGATDEELQWFLYQADILGLNPLTKQIWFIKRIKKQKDAKTGQWDYPKLANGEIDYTKGDLIIQASKEGLFAKATENDNFHYIQSMEVRENDEFDMEFDPESMQMKVIKHKFQGKGRGDIIGAWAVVVYKDGTRDWNYIDFNEVCQTYDDKSGAKKSTGVWANNPTAMVKKCAESPLLRKAARISGVYTDAEAATFIEEVDTKVLDNSPEKTSLREEEITRIKAQIEACQTMEEFEKLIPEIAQNKAGLLTEEIEELRNIAGQKRKTLQESLKKDEEQKTQEQTAIQEPKS